MNLNQHIILQLQVDQFLYSLVLKRQRREIRYDIFFLLLKVFNLHFQERAIMPRPSATDAIDTSIELQQQRLNPTVNTSLILSSDITNSNSSSDYRQQSSSTPTRLIQQNSFSSTHSDDNTSNIQEQTNDTTTSSSNSIPIARNKNSDSMKIITTPNISPPISPIQSLHSISRPLMQDKSIQCIDDEDNENSIGRDGMETIDDGQIITSKKIIKEVAAYIPSPVIFLVRFFLL
jgi:hypothetical protein